MEKIIRRTDYVILKPILDNWLVWGNEWKNSNETKFSWRKMLPNGGHFHLKKEALNELFDELTHNRCAICDFYPLIDKAHFTDGVSVEHFFPKDRNTIYSIYAYQWDNLFPLCQTCNNVKGSEFSCLLLKPDEEHYNFDDFFIVKGDGKVAPNPTKDKHSQNRACKTIKTYCLNRGELKKNRRKKVEKFENAIKKYGINILNSFPINEEPYYFFIKRSISNNDINKNFDELFNDIQNDQ